MGPLPYPHRAMFLASRLTVPAELATAVPYLARLVSVIVFDHMVRHRIVTLADDEEHLHGDEAQLEDSIDWYFRVSRRHEVLWFELSFDAARPAAPALFSRLPSGAIQPWRASPEPALSQQLGQCLAQWLAARRLTPVGPLPDFTLDDVRIAADRLRRADAELAHGRAPAVDPPRLAVPFLRVLGELARAPAPALLRLDPAHPVARRDHYVAALLAGDVDRRAILPLIGDAPMYGVPHLSVWGDAFAADRPLENMGVRHQGIAASLMPANPYACHNYSLQLAEVGRREESYRWADRATVASPQFGAAHLDCVRRLRQVGRPGQAFAEAQYRCREIVERAEAGSLPANDWQAPHHAALLLAFVHLDAGRIAEAIELADAAIARLPDDVATRESFAWARQRIAHWKTDAGLLARAYAWEGHHRADPGRVIAGLARGRLTDDDDAMMWIDALIAIGRPEQAEIAVAQCAGLGGPGVLGDGKARLAAARALILAGDVDEALAQIQIVQLRRGQSRLEADINRTLRLAAIRPAHEWERAIERRLAIGAASLARDAARDLADFVPDLDAALVDHALGERTPLAIDRAWIEELCAGTAAPQAVAIAKRLAWPRPRREALAAADALAQEWWTALAPPSRDRDAHAAGAMLALGLALGHYFVAAAGPPTPIAGAYRHIATEALHLVRRSRYQIEPAAIRALLRTVDRYAAAPEWLLDTWLLRIERALDLEAEHGAYLDGMIAGMPAVQRLLRGDERVGWELRLAHDLAQDPSQYEPAAALFARCARAVEAGTAHLAWSAAAPSAQLDVHWLAAAANPSAGAPLLRVARELLETGRRGDGFDAACRGIAATPDAQRAAAITALAPAWRAAGIRTPLDGAAAFDAGVAAAEEQRLDLAVEHLRWAAATEPAHAVRAQSLAVALARTGAALPAVSALSRCERDAPRLIGRVLLDAGRDAEAVALLRYASRSFRSTDDWASLVRAASRASEHAVAVEAGRRALALGGADADLLIALATSLYRMGEFRDCERVAQQLITEGARDARLAGLHAMARALAGQGRHADAQPYAKAAAELGPNGALAAELIETLDRIVAHEAPRVRPSMELSPERQAWADLEAGAFERVAALLDHPSWGVARAALAASEFRTAAESAGAVAPRALEAALAILERTTGAADPDAVLARIRALRIRDNAFIQIDPPPPLGRRYTAEEFEQAYAERDRRPRRASASFGFAR